MPPGRTSKEFHEYLVEPSSSHVMHDDYSKSPATAFLRYTVDAKDAINACQKYFKKNTRIRYSKDSLSSLEHISSALLPSIMGHFETYQKYLFAGVFEYSILLERFDIDKFFKELDKLCNFTIDPIRLSAYRCLDAQIGLLLADNLQSWHSPEKVNKYFKSFGFSTDFFSNADCKRLKVLWQLRHSIVHTGGTITIPDAQKVDELVAFGNQPAVFQKNFILEVSRKMHPLIKGATGRIESCFRANLKSSISPEEQKRIDDLFKVHSKVAVWLK